MHRRELALRRARRRHLEDLRGCGAHHVRRLHRRACPTAAARGGRRSRGAARSLGR